MTIVVITTFTGFFKDPSSIFRQFLVVIGILTAYSVVKGVRAIQIMKGSEIKKIDFISLYILTAAGLFLIGAAIYSFLYIEMTVAIIFGVFGMVCVSEFPGQWKRLTQPMKDKKEWFRVHIAVSYTHLTLPTICSV